MKAAELATSYEEIGNVSNKCKIGIVFYVIKYMVKCVCIETSKHTKLFPKTRSTGFHISQYLISLFLQFLLVFEKCIAKLMIHHMDPEEYQIPI